MKSLCLRLIYGISLLAASTVVTAESLKTERVIIVTVDGLRLQELFTGLDPMLMEAAESKDDAIKKKAGIDDLKKLKADYWRDTPEARREAIMPFLWTTLVPNGIMLGNPAKDSIVLVENGFKVSYPGYAEILTGKPQRRIWGNLDIPNPQTTVMEFVQAELGLGYKDVAAFASWSKFHYICARKVDAFFNNSGYQRVPDDIATPGMEPLNTLQFDMLTPWDTVRHDTVTLTLALEYLKAYQPKLLFLSLGETDDWAHNNRYDRVIHGARLVDNALKTLWETLQSLDAYKDKTTILITGDHGRGSTLDDWNGHATKIPGSEHIWTLVIGPDTPARGELANTRHTQGQAAATVAKFFGLDYTTIAEEIAPPIAEAFKE